jgi:ADP-ribosylglycohydrolase
VTCDDARHRYDAAAMDLRERAIGAVLGLALGDALGAPFAGRRAHDVPDPLPAFELPWNGSAPGSTGGATAMARLLTASLVGRGRFDGDDVTRRYTAWVDTDPAGVDPITRRVLTAIGDGDADAARAHVERRGPEVSAGNGSVRACAPLGVAYARRPDALSMAAPALSAITHWDERCRTACLAITLATAALVRGEPPDAAIEVSIGATLDRDGGEELEFLVQEAGRARPIDGPDSGFCLFTAGVALRTARDARDVEGGLRSVVALGGDTDTNAAVAGALLGARAGVDGLPTGWLARLADRDAIGREAARLGELAERVV